jgi:hypothetical protein
MNRRVAGNTAYLIGLYLCHHRGMRRIFVKVGASTMALKTICIGKRLVQADRSSHPDASIIRDYVSDPIEFSFDRSHKTVVDVAGIALIVTYPSIAKMASGQYRALGILQIRYPGRHRMTRRAKAQSFGALERKIERGEREQNRRYAEHEQQKQFFPRTQVMPRSYEPSFFT